MPADQFHARDLAWALGSACASHGKPFDAALLLKQFAPPYSDGALVAAAQAIGFHARVKPIPLKQLSSERGLAFPLIQNKLTDGESCTTLCLLVGKTSDAITFIPSGGDAPGTESLLVAFQMFALRLSLPLMRKVDLWQQFLQARLAVERLGDLMNAPPEPYSIIPSRRCAGSGHIDIAGLTFRYAEDLPFLYESLSLSIAPGKTITLMGPSGSDKSTLAKLLLGFYGPTQGPITMDGIDIRHLSANELRSNFGSAAVL